MLPMLFVAMPVLAETPVYEIEIKQHLFIPSEITIPQATKIKLVIYNRDSSSEEFESNRLNREKMILAGRKGILYIGPLEAGEYPFSGEFHPKTAVGRIIVK